MTVSQELAEFCTQVTYSDLPPEVVEAVKRCVYDSVGCAFGGVRTREYELADQVARDLGGDPQCRIIGSGRMANVTSAAFLNALAVRALDRNDTYGERGLCHPSELIPGVWACAELVDAGGEDVVLAIALAYELEMRLCEAALSGLQGRGWHPATLTAFAAAWACAKVLDLDVEETAHAIGIAGSRHGTLGCVGVGEPGMMKHTADPMATQAGAWGALLARAGYEGPSDVFCGEQGLAEAIGPECRLDVLSEGLGDSWRILECELGKEGDLPVGHPRAPMTDEQMSAKFDAMCGDEVPESQREEIREAIGKLPQVPARRFMELLAFRG